MGARGVFQTLVYCPAALALQRLHPASSCRSLFLQPSPPPQNGGKAFAGSSSCRKATQGTHPGNPPSEPTQRTHPASLLYPILTLRCQTPPATGGCGDGGAASWDPSCSPPRSPRELLVVLQPPVPPRSRLQLQPRPRALPCGLRCSAGPGSGPGTGTALRSAMATAGSGGGGGGKERKREE